jgi:hypothetical protein
MVCTALLVRGEYSRDEIKHEMNSWADIWSAAMLILIKLNSWSQAMGSEATAADLGLDQIKRGAIS